VGRYLREHVRPGDVVIVDPPHIAELYEYYASSEAPWVGLPLLNSRRPIRWPSCKSWSAATTVSGWPLVHAGVGRPERLSGKMAD